MTTCIIAGCDQPARNNLGVRCRKPTTRAVWAPNLDAFLCKKHAEAGVDITLSVEAATHGRVDATVVSGGAQVGERTTPIRRRAA